MNLTLCMVVKNEAHRVRDCLEGVSEFCEEIIVVDDNSSDDTRKHLVDAGVTVLPGSPAGFSQEAEQRNLALERVRTPWILCLDADERMPADALDVLQRFEPPDDVAGCFVPWNTYVEDGVIEDYKLALFRRGVRFSGKIHSNVQSHFRQLGLNAIWHESLQVEHFPDLAAESSKRTSYERRLLEAIDSEPELIRYHWFLGYDYFRQNRLQEAFRYLTIAAESNSPHFPVESLNARMVLTEAFCNIGSFDKAAAHVISGLAFQQIVCDDFEVGINFRLKSWFEEALIQLNSADRCRVRAYRFAS